MSLAFEISVVVPTVVVYFGVSWVSRLSLLSSLVLKGAGLISSALVTCPPL